MAGNLPVYIQIHDKIQEDIEKGKWSVGTRLPSERELALTFGVSRMTLRQAIQTLADEGILERKIGSGTYVANKKVQEKMKGITSFTEIMESQGRTPSSKTVSYHIAVPSSSEMKKLQLKPNQTILRMERIRYADNTPICFEVASIPSDLIENFSKEEITKSLYQVLEKKGLHKLGGATQTISSMLASEQIAAYLNIRKGEAILRLRQLSYLKNGQPFEYVRTQYAGSRFEFFLEK